MENINILESSNIKKVHFIGIGGISMSGLAEILLSRGYIISGSDAKSSNITEKLKKAGMTIFQNHAEENILNPDLVVYTAAIKENNPELVKSRALNIPTIERSTLLGNIMSKYPYSIAVSGTHGKTTTTSMVTMAMLESNLDPTIHIGGELSAIGGSTKVGSNNYFVTEACEYVESFLKFHPYIAIFLNIDADHLDYFKDIEHIKSSFIKFASQIAKDGYLVACVDDPNIVSILDKVECNVITYGVNNNNAKWTTKNITFDTLGCASFTLLKNNIEICEIKLNVPGIHNVSNAISAAVTCYTLGCNIDNIKIGLSKFLGTRRRFELKGVVDGIKVVDDYAHHPTEVTATLNAAKKGNYSKVWCVFQPHTYTRTSSLLNEFSSSFLEADEVLITDIYAAREIDTGVIHSNTLVKKINDTGKNAIYISSFEEIAQYLNQKASSGDLVITMGAGNIDKVGELFIDLKNKK